MRVLFAVTVYLSVFMFTYVDDGWRNFEPGYIYLLMFMFTCVDVVFNFGQARVPFILHTINDAIFKLMITFMDDYEDFTNCELTVKSVTVQITENKDPNKQEKFQRFFIYVIRILASNMYVDLWILKTVS